MKYGKTCMCVTLGAATIAVFGGMNWIRAAKITGESATNAQKSVTAFLGAGDDGVRQIPAFESWLGTPMTVGHTYLSGATWDTIEGDPGIIGPWANWLRQQPGRALA